MKKEVINKARYNKMLQTNGEVDREVRKMSKSPRLSQSQQPVKLPQQILSVA